MWALVDLHFTKQVCAACLLVNVTTLLPFTKESKTCSAATMASPSSSKMIVSWFLILTLDEPQGAGVESDHWIRLGICHLCHTQHPWSRVATWLKGCVHINMNPVSETGVYRSWDVGFQQFNQLKRGNEFICEGFEAAGNMQLRSPLRQFLNRLRKSWLDANCNLLNLSPSLLLRLSLEMQSCRKSTNLILRLWVFLTSKGPKHTAL